MAKTVDVHDVLHYFETGSGTALVKACVRALEHSPNIWRLAELQQLRFFSRRAHVGDGEAVCEVMRAFQPYARTDPAAGLQAVNQYLSASSYRFKPGASINDFKQTSMVRDTALAVAADAQIAIIAWTEHYTRRINKKKKS